MKYKFFHDRYNGKLHCYNQHKVTKAEVIEAFPNLIKWHRDESAIARLCQAANGEKMEIIHVWNIPNKEVFIITAYYL